MLSCFSIERELNSTVIERIGLQGLCRSGEHDQQVGYCLQQITSPWIQLLSSAALHFWWTTFQPFISQCSFKLLIGVFWSCWFVSHSICVFSSSLSASRQEFSIWNLWFSLFSSIVKLSKLLIYCTGFFYYYYLHFRRCSNIPVTGPSVYPVSGQNRQEGISPPVVNQLNIYSFPRRGRTLWGICFHTLVIIMGSCSIVLALCISSFWFTVVAIQKECEVCLLYFVLYPTVPSRCLQTAFFTVFWKVTVLKSLLGCRYMYVVICPNVRCSDCFSSPRSFYCLLIVKL